jgi:O-antigen/teichoic acid export membrane protein
MLGTGLGRGLPFLLLPIVTVQLSVADYGKLSLATTVAGFLAIIIGMNPNLFVYANFFKYDREALSVRLFNILIVAAASVVPVALVYTLFGGLVEEYHITGGLFLVLIVVALGRSVAAMHLAVEQMERRPVPYLVFYFLMAGAVVGALLVLIAIERFTWQSLLFAEAGILFVLNVVYLWRVASRGFLVMRPDLSAMSEFVRFSSPLLGHVIALWAISFLDRMVIAAFVGVDAVGAYSVAHTVALGLSLVHESIHRAWQPIFFKKMQSSDLAAQRHIVRYTWGYFGVTILSAAFYLVFMQYLLGLFLPPTYQQAFIYLPYLVTGFALLGMYRFAAGYFYHYGNTKVLSLITVGCSVLHIGVMTALVERFGAVGAAYAGVLTYFVLLLSVMALGAKIHSVQWLRQAT